MVLFVSFVGLLAEFISFYRFFLARLLALLARAGAALVAAPARSQHDHRVVVLLRAHAQDARVLPRHLVVLVRSRCGDVFIFYETVKSQSKSKVVAMLKMGEKNQRGVRLYFFYRRHLGGSYRCSDDQQNNYKPHSERSQFIDFVC